MPNWHTDKHNTQEKTTRITILHVSTENLFLDSVKPRGSLSISNNGIAREKREEEDRGRGREKKGQRRRLLSETTNKSELNVNQWSNGLKNLKL